MDQSELDQIWDFGDPATSEANFRAAIAQPDRSPADRAELETQLARALGLQERFDEATAVLDAVDWSFPLARIRAELERGRLLNSSGNPEDAIPHVRAASDLAATNGAEYLSIDALHMLAIVDKPRTTAWTEQALAVVDASNSPRVRRWGIALHNNLGWHWHDAGDYPAALAEFELASRAATESGSSQQQFVARWAIARCLRSLGRIDDALAIQTQLAIEDPNDEYVQAEIGELTNASG